MHLFRVKADEETVALIRCYIQRNYQAPEVSGGRVRYSIEMTEEPGVLQLQEEREAQLDRFMLRVQAEERLAREAADAFLAKLTDRTFTQMVMPYIQRKRLRDADVYRAANIDQRLFSKIISDEHFHPSKDTALAIVFALHLTLPEANDLLGRAGYTLSHSDRRDLVIEYFIRSRNCDILKVNATLDKLGMKTIGR